MKQEPPTRARWAAALAANKDRNTKPRNRVLVSVDIIVSVVLAIVALGVALAVAGNATLYLGVLQECTPAQVDGLTCNGTVLGIVCIALIVIAVLGFLLAIGMVVISAIRRKWTFWWPLGAIVVMIGLFYLGTWIIGMTVPATVAA